MRLPTYAFIGVIHSGSGPGSVVVEVFAALTVGAVRVVATVTDQFPFPIRDATRGVTVAFTASAHREVGQGVIVALFDAFFFRILVSKRLQTVEDDPDIRGGHPVLQHRAVVEVVRRGPPLQRTERHPGPAVGVDVAVGVRTQRLLLVDLGDEGVRFLVVHLLAGAGVELIRDPRLAVIHAFVDGHGVRAGRAELEADVRDLVLLVQRERQGHVLRILDERFGHPARDVVWVVEISEVGGRMPPLGVRRVADVAVSGRLPILVRRGLAVAAGRAAARAGGGHFLSERRVDEVRDATPGMAVLVVTGVDWSAARHQHVHETGRTGEYLARSGVQHE